MLFTCSWLRLDRAWPLSKPSIPLDTWMWAPTRRMTVASTLTRRAWALSATVSANRRMLPYSFFEGRNASTIGPSLWWPPGAADRNIRIRWDAETSRATGGFETLPDFIALPRDEQGRPIIPRTRVTALVEAQQAWESGLRTLDAVTATSVAGKLVMPKVALPSQQTFLRNHPWWEKDLKAKEALGPVIAKWLATGVLEYVAWNDRMPVLLQACGPVPRGTAPFYRLITDACFANEMYSDWGVSYTTASQLCSTLNRCDFTFSVDMSDEHHLSLWAGCGRELRAVRRPVLSTRQDGAERLTWIDALVNGCTPSSCRGGCDNGIMIDGHIFRFASCQFGQKTAGSPLGAIVRSVARYFARLH